MVKGLGKEAEATDRSREPSNLLFMVLVTRFDS